jgi:hypothetical protein
VAVKPKPLEINDSNWKADLKLKEGEQLELSLFINRELVTDAESVVLYKNNSVVAQPNLSSSLINGKTEIKVIVAKLCGADSGDYTLSLESASKKQKIELASTYLEVVETPFEIVAPLQADKLEYVVGETIALSLVSTRAVEDSDKCVEWLLNGKSLTVSNSPNIEFSESKMPDEDVVTYALTLKDAQVKNDGEYTVKIK